LPREDSSTSGTLLKHKVINYVGLTMTEQLQVKGSIYEHIVCYNQNDRKL